jgi:hypothetical protein
MRIDTCAMGVALLLLLYACAKDPLPIGTVVHLAKSAPCAPTEAGLEQVLTAETRGSELELYRTMDRVNAIEVKAGDSGTVISDNRDKVRVRLPEGSINRLHDHTCWVKREAIVKSD